MASTWHGGAGWGVAGVLLVLAMPATAQTRLEYSVKANYLVRFAAFVEWQPQAFASAQSPVVICTTGRDPFSGGLETASRGQTAHGRSLVVRRPAAGSLTGCHILYVGQGSTEAVTASAGRPGLLVVTDNAAGPNRGAVHFVVHEGRVRFHIDQSAATRSGLRVNSRLLNLALTVRG